MEKKSQQGCGKQTQQCGTHRCFKDWAALSIYELTYVFPFPQQFFGKFGRVTRTLLCCLFLWNTRYRRNLVLVFDCHFSCWQLFPRWLNLSARAWETQSRGYLHCSFHFCPIARVCFNKNLTECSFLSEEFFNVGMSSVGGHSRNTLLCLKEPDGSVRAGLTRRGV